MTSDNSDDKALVPAPNTASVPMSIPLAPTANLDLSMLSEEDRSALIKEYAGGMINLAQKAQELKINVGVLEETLVALVQNTNEVAASGNAVTITHVQESSIGHTEVIMGNTPQAESGKLTKSQSGAPDWTPYYVAAVLIVIVIIAVAALAR